jgi:multiple sugar transport system ATP-binding protein
MAEVAFEAVSKGFDDGTIAVNNLDLTIADGEFVALVGPSGCGKSTALRLVAGLEDPTEGTIWIGADPVNTLAPPDRDVAMVFQTYALYPHMTAAQNIGFPLRMAGVSRQESGRRIADAARLLGIEELLDRKPGQLSGGQRQRVAMGRAIVRQPQAFLMDEPLSNLDAAQRVLMRAELINLRRRLGVTTLYVTHDQVEALTLSDRVAVMRDGVIQQTDTPRRVYRAPRNTYVASFIGSPPMNFISAQLDGSALRVGENTVQVPDAWAGESGAVFLGIRSEALAPAESVDQPQALRFQASVEMVEELGGESIAHLRTNEISPAELGQRPIELHGTLAMRVAARSETRTGERIRVGAALDDVHLFDATTGQAVISPPS